MNVTIRLTWYSAIRPSRMSTRCSLTHALRTLRSVFVARATPSLIASSKLFVEVEQGDFDAVAGEAAGRGGAEAGRAAGDDGGDVGGEFHGRGS